MKRLIPRLERWLHSRGLARTRHGRIELRSTEETTPLFRRALVLLAEFHPVALRRVEDAFDVIIETWMPRWGSSISRTAYINPEQLGRHRELLAAAILLRWSTAVQIRRRRERFGLPTATRQERLEVGRASVRPMRSFIAWYGLRYDLSEEYRVGLVRWTEEIVADTGRSRLEHLRWLLGEARRDIFGGE